MFGVWLSFFREHCAGFVALFVLLPVTLFINWRLGAMLIGLVAIFGAGDELRHPPHRRPCRAAPTVASRDLPSASPTRSATCRCCRAFARIEEEARRLRAPDRAAVSPRNSRCWPGGRSPRVATRASATLTLIGVLRLRHLARHARAGRRSAQIVAFMGLASELIGRLDQIVGFLNFASSAQAPKLAQFFDMMRSRPRVADRPGARRRRAAARAMCASRGVASPMPRSAPALRERQLRRAAPGRRSRWSARTGSGKSTALALLHRVFDPDARARSPIDGATSAT